MTTPETAEQTQCMLCARSTKTAPTLGGVLRRCVSCGFLWTADNGSKTATAELYDADYFQGGGYRDYFAEADQRRYESRRRLRWLLSYARPQSLVEAGAAAGFFVQQAQRAGVHATGIEPSQECVRFARDELDMPVRQGCFETSPPTAPTDAVCAFHVLEHVDDPHLFLATARGALAPGGWIALEVPNIASVAAAREGTAWHGLQPAFHRWHFSPESLPQLVRSHGFVIRHCDTVAVSYYLHPRHWLSPRGAFLLAKECARHGNPRSPHPCRHDLLRLLACVPEGSS